MVPHQQETLDQFLRALRRRRCPDLPCPLLLGHRHQTLARSVDPAIPDLWQKLNCGLYDRVALLGTARLPQRTAARPDPERTRLHLPAILRPAGKSQLRLAAVLSGVCPGMPAAHLAYGPQENLPEDLKKRIHHGDTKALRKPWEVRRLGSSMGATVPNTRMIE